MPEMTGRLTLVQEGRFRLACDEGRAVLFLLAPGAPLEPQDLEALLRDGGRVTVRFDRRPGLIAGIARDVLEARR